jgi:hypothetical protein
MQKRRVVTRCCISADPHPPEAVHPALRAFDDPTPGCATCLGLPGLGLLASCHSYALDRLPCLLDIMAMRSVHGQTDGDATAVGAEAAFGAERAAIGGVLAHLFPHGGLGSWRRPSPATPRPRFARHAMLPGLVPIRPHRPPPPPTLGHGSRQNAWNRYGSGAAHATGIRY